MNKTECRGWLKEFLQTQMRGLTGHIEEAGFPFDRVQWGKPDVSCENENPKWWVYEQTAYWLDGFTRAASLLEDGEALHRASDIIYSVINAPDADGYLGPACLKENKPWNRWPHVVFFRACFALYEYNGDMAIIRAIERHYLKSPADYSVGRDVLNVEIMLYVYGATLNDRLFRLAEENFEKYEQNTTDDLHGEVALSNKKPRAHGVSYNEFFKLGAILYKYTGNKKYLAESVAAYKKIDEFFMLPSGGICSDEFLESNHYMRATETCDVSDYTWSLAQLFDATKDGAYGDKIERCVFNAGIGAVLEDFKGLQYFSCANQLIADKHSNHCKFFRGGKWMSYRPNPGTECCPGNVNRFMPNYVRNMWRTENNEIYAVLFGASVYTTQIGGASVRIEQKTNYPFEENIEFCVSAQTPFRFYIRLPEWTENCVLTVNGKSAGIEKENGFLSLYIQKDSVISLRLESSVKAHRRGKTVYFTKGALTYCLGMYGDRQIDVSEDRSSKLFPAYNIYADKEWRYAVKPETAEFFPCENAEKWDCRENLPMIKVKAARIENYDFIRRKSVIKCVSLYNFEYVKEKGDFVFTPPVPRRAETCGEEEQLYLKPYGACKIRETVFADISKKDSRSKGL